jgi:hypothetical protein
MLYVIIYKCGSNLAVHIVVFSFTVLSDITDTLWESSVV